MEEKKIERWEDIPARTQVKDWYKELREINNQEELQTWVKDIRTYLEDNFSRERFFEFILIEDCAKLRKEYLTRSEKHAEI